MEEQPQPQRQAVVVEDKVSKHLNKPRHDSTMSERTEVQDQISARAF